MRPATPSRTIGKEIKKARRAQISPEFLILSVLAGGFDQAANEKHGRAAKPRTPEQKVVALQLPELLGGLFVILDGQQFAVERGRLCANPFFEWWQQQPDEKQNRGNDKKYPMHGAICALDLPR